MNSRLIWEQLREFHEAFKLPIGETPDLPGPELASETMLFYQELSVIAELIENFEKKVAVSTTRGLRIKLLLEEVREYLEAEANDNIVDIADALCDIHYIAAGTEVAYGIPGKLVFDHVHENNMSKLGPDGQPIYNDEGKVVKPEGYEPPDIAQFVHPI